MVDLITYERIVRELASTKSSVVYYNSGNDHATIVLENILLSARKNVKFLTGGFNHLVCEDKDKRFVSALKKFLLNNGKLEVVMNRYLNDKTAYNSVLDVLKQYSSTTQYRQNISVKYLAEEFQYKGFNVHFAVADSSMYRLEYDTEKFLAEFSFNGTSKCTELESKFKEIFDKATSLDLSTLKY